MGLFEFIKSQLLEVIEWTDSSSDLMVYRFPVQGSEIKMGAKLIVREAQAAVFLDKGQLADVFGPGMYTLKTDNLPLLTKIQSWPYGFNSPFKCDVYFVNTRQFTDQKWGTPNPVMLRDAEFGPVRLRAFGIFAMRVSDPAKFLREVVGTHGSFTNNEILGHLKRMIVSGFTDLLGEANLPALELASKYDELSSMAREKLVPRFQEHGLEITQFYVENISLPQEVERALDERSRMGVLGDLGRYTQLKTAEAIGDAAKNPGGLAGSGMGLGAGLGMGAMMANTVGGAFAAGQQPPQQQQAAPQATNPQGAKFCTNCGGALPADARFCPGCGTALAPPA